MAHIQCNFFSQALQKNANVIIYLPTQDADDYLFGTGNAKYGRSRVYKTLYLLHGSYGDYMDWTRLANADRYAQEHNIAVVMPSAENSKYLNMYLGENYMDYIGKELPEFLGTIFPLSDKREDTYIAGLSMGGYGAMRIGLEFPERFGAICSLSGGLDMDMLNTGNTTEAHVAKFDKNYMKAISPNEKMAGTRDDLLYLLKAQLDAGKPIPKLFMACGTEDFIFPSNEKFYAEASKLVPIDYTRAPGVHDWKFWDCHLQEALDWLAKL